MDQHDSWSSGPSEGEGGGQSPSPTRGDQWWTPAGASPPPPPGWQPPPPPPSGWQPPPPPPPGWQAGGPPPPAWLAGPPPSYGPAGYPTRRWNGLAIASFVLSIFWVFGLGSLLAVIFGLVALGQTRRAAGWQKGRGLAIAGLVIGFLGVLLIVFGIAGAMVHGGVQVHHARVSYP